MNILKALFSSEAEETNFFDDAALPISLVDNDERPWRDQTDTVATVKSKIEPGQIGHVTFRGVRWRASCNCAVRIPNNAQVRVIGRRANILVVEPAEMSVQSSWVAA